MDKDQTYQLFEDAYNKLSEPIFRHCYFRIYDRERAKELAQETFIKVWDYLRKGNKIDNIQAFTYTVARNLIINEIQRRKRSHSLDDLNETEGFDPPSGENIQEELQRDEDASKVFEKINQINPSYKEVVLMKYIDELSVKEIAEIVGESENNISVRIHRGLEKLRELYKKDEREY